MDYHLMAKIDSVGYRSDRYFAGRFSVDPVDPVDLEMSHYPGGLVVALVTAVEVTVLRVLC